MCLDIGRGLRFEPLHSACPAAHRAGLVHTDPNPAPQSSRKPAMLLLILGLVLFLGTHAFSMLRAKRAGVINEVGESRF